MGFWPFGKRAIRLQTLGDAHFADEEEIRAAGLLNDDGIRLGLYYGERVFAPFARVRGVEFRDGLFVCRQEVLRYKGDAHLITVAPTRSGKSRDILIPALLEYPGSCIVIDPKGQLAAVTRAQRERMGQKVIVLNPFNLISDKIGKTAHYNPMALLDPGSKAFGADCAKMAEAIVVHGGDSDSHWTDSARGLVSGIIGHLAATGRRDEQNLAMVRDIIAGQDDVLVAFAKEAAKAGNSFNRQKLARFANEKAQNWGELSSIISNARTQTDFLGIETIADNVKRSDFRFDVLKSSATTVYLVLPGEYLDTCGKWFRLIVASALHELWRGPKGTYPVLAILDEFAQLGRLTVIENAMAMAAGYGLQLWPILQDLTQLKKHYGESWETFLSGAEIQQFFGPRDQTTADYISKRSGVTTVVTHSESAGSSMSWSAGQTQQPLLHPHNASGLGQYESIIFGPKNITIRAYREPYFNFADLRTRASLDPYHSKSFSTKDPISKHFVLGSFVGYDKGKDQLYADYLPYISSDWLKREDVSGAPGAKMLHVPTGLEFSVHHDEKKEDPIMGCVASIGEIGSVSDYDLAHPAIVAFLDTIGIRPHQVWSRVVQRSLSWAVRLTPEYIREGVDFEPYEPSEWLLTKDSPWPHIRHLPTKAAFAIMHNTVRTEADGPLDPFMDFAAIQTDYGEITSATLSRRLRSDNISRTAIVAFLDHNGIPPGRIWPELYRAIRLDKELAEKPCSAYKPYDWEEVFDEGTAKRPRHTPTGWLFQIILNRCEEKRGLGGENVFVDYESVFACVYKPGNPLGAAAIRSLMRLALVHETASRYRRCFQSRNFIHESDVWHQTYEPSEWSVVSEPSAPCDPCSSPRIYHGPTGIEFIIGFDGHMIESLSEMYVDPRGIGHELAHLARIAFFDHSSYLIWPAGHPRLNRRVYEVVALRTSSSEFHVPYETSEWTMTSDSETGQAWMHHAASDLDFAIVFGHENIKLHPNAEDKYLACIIGPSEKSLPRELVGLGSTAIVAYLSGIGISPETLSFKSTQLAPFAPEGERYAPYQPSEWTQDKDEASALVMHHAPSNATFIIVEHHKRVLLNVELNHKKVLPNPFRDYSSISGGPLTLPNGYEWYSLARTAIVAFLDQNGTPPNQIWPEKTEQLSVAAASA